MMIRDIAKIEADTLDVLVIGGGVYGASITCHVAKAGYRTALLEKNDFCGATSANSLKILHGGLRYLQHLNIKRMRQSIAARREMMQLAPHLVEPLPCMMPLYGHGLRGKNVMRTALFLNDCIGWDRNQNLPPALHIPKGDIVSQKRCLEVIPSLAAENLHGAAVWYDVLTESTERLVLEYILEGVRHGAQVANYGEITAVARGGDGLYHVSVRDTLDGQVFLLRTRYIVNAAGPWLENYLSPSSQGVPRQKWALALNVVSRKKIFSNYAVALEGQRHYDDKDAIVKRGKRLYFFVPWRGHTMIGTDYQESASGPDDLQVTRDIIEEMVDEINAIYPPARLTYEDISFYHAGLLPMTGLSEAGNVQLEKNSMFWVHPGSDFSRVLSVKGVKYTTAPETAHEIVRFLAKQFQPGSNTEKPVDASVPSEPWPEKYAGLQAMVSKKYGQRAGRILSYLSGESDDALWIDEDGQLLKAEVRYLIREEMACTLSDIVFRRTGLGTAGCPQLHVLVALSNYMGDFLGWDEERKHREREDVLHRYYPLISGNV